MGVGVFFCAFVEWGLLGEDHCVLNPFALFFRVFFQRNHAIAKAIGSSGLLCKFIVMLMLRRMVESAVVSGIYVFGFSYIKDLFYVDDIHEGIVVASVDYIYPCYARHR